MYVSIMPSYYCNANCDYCYLGNLVRNKTLLNLKVLKRMLIQLSNTQKDLNVCVYGGEISLLDESYLDELFSICKQFTSKISAVSNFTKPDIATICERNNVKLGISLNVERKINASVEKKLLKHKPKIALSIVVLPSVLNKSPNQVLEYCAQFKPESVRFIQYSNSVLAKKQYNITNKEFEDFLIAIHSCYSENAYSFKIENFEHVIKNPLAMDCIFITPKNKFAQVAFTERNEEFFVEFDSLLEYNKFCMKEIAIKKQCLYCKYLKTKCAADHLKHKPSNDICNGLLRLSELL